MADLASPDLSVIIVSWNTREFLRLCLNSVCADLPGGNAGSGDPLHQEVWVVDNASQDGSSEMVRTAYPHVRLIGNTENRGYAAANNQALALARGRHAILLNPDTEVPPGALARMVRFLDEHPRAAVVGPRLVLRRGQVQGGAAGYEPSPWTVFNHSFFLYKLAPRVFRGLWLAKRQYRGRAPIAVDWVSGAALMVRMAAVQQVGLLDEGYFMYAEDVDWCRRLRKGGWQVYCLPDVRVLHHIGRSTQQRGAEFFATNVHSLDRYYRLHYGPATVRLLHLFGAGGFLLRAMAYSVLYRVRRRGVYRELSQQWWACARASLGHLTRTGATSAAEAGQARLARDTLARPLAAPGIENAEDRGPGS